MGDDAWETVGGLQRSPMQNVTWPLVSLLATSERLSFRPRFGLGHVTGTWSVDQAQVRRIRATRIWWSTGIELLLDDGRRWVFWTFVPDEALRRLERMGYPVPRP